MMHCQWEHTCPVGGTAAPWSSSSSSSPPPSPAERCIGAAGDELFPVLRKTRSPSAVCARETKQNKNKNRSPVVVQFIRCYHDNFNKNYIKSQ